MYRSRYPAQLSQRHPWHLVPGALVYGRSEQLFYDNIPFDSREFQTPILCVFMQRQKLEQRDGKLMMTKVLLEPALLIASERDRERATRILQKAETACLITNSIKSSVTLQPTIRVQG